MTARSPNPECPRNNQMIIIGIDTALRCTGYGVVEMDGKQFRAEDCGVIRNRPMLPVSECLRRLAGGIEELIENFHPDIAAIEGTFYSKNARTAMVLGMARGAVVSRLAQHQIPAFEYAPRKAKKIVVGYGNASKEQVADFMAKMLGLAIKEIPDDATDAIALAVCHGLMLQTANGIYVPDPL